LTIFIAVSPVCCSHLGTDTPHVPRYVAFIDNEEEVDVNSVSLTGNLATDIELREFGEDKRRATFRIAVHRPSKSDETDFFSVTTWDRQAELCAEHLSKGQKVGVEGWLRQHTWEAEGERRSLVEVVARRVEFLGSKSADSGGEVVPFEAAVA
jgi:single-strand DNA-binding protein